MAIRTCVSVIKCKWIQSKGRVAEWIKRKKKKDPYIYAAYKRLTSDLTTHTNWKWGMEQDIPANENQKEAKVAIVISGKIDFKIKTLTRNKEGHYIMIKESIQEKDITMHPI